MRSIPMTTAGRLPRMVIDKNAPLGTEKWEKENCPAKSPNSSPEKRTEQTTIFDHYGPILRAQLWNPVERAFRTAALVRGKYPYVLIVDDLKKDDSTHLYEWAMQMPEDVEVIKSGGTWMVLGAKNISLRSQGQRGVMPSHSRTSGDCLFRSSMLEPSGSRWDGNATGSPLPRTMSLSARAGSGNAWSSPQAKLIPVSKFYSTPSSRALRMPDVRWNRGAQITLPLHGKTRPMISPLVRAKGDAHFTRWNTTVSRWRHSRPVPEYRPF